MSPPSSQSADFPNILATPALAPHFSACWPVVQGVVWAWTQQHCLSLALCNHKFASCLHSCPFWTLHKSEMTQYVAFCVWLLSPHLVSRVRLCCVGVRTSLFLWLCICVWTDHVLITHLSTDRCLGGLYVLASVNKAAVSIHVRIERGKVTNNTTKVQKAKRDYCEQLYTNKMNHRGEMANS